MSRKLGMTDEEKVALKIAGIISDLRLDLDRVGIYLARLKPSIPYRRLQIIAESAEQERESNGIKITHYPLF